MGISSDEMNALMEAREEKLDRVEVRKVKLCTGERRKKDRRKPAGMSKDFLGMEKRIGPDRRTNPGKGRIKHNLEYKSL